MNRYHALFTRKVFELLGGYEMAQEFFELHPELPEKMRAAALYHKRKGGAAWKGACVFHRFELTPLLRADRRAATLRPIPAKGRGIDPDIDIRR
jgi:hypothetical protein